MTISKKKNSLPSRTASPTAAAAAILNVAERLAQTRGYNGFSYADIAEELGVTKASLHYHFPSKAELGRALITRYQAVFAAALETIDRQTDRKTTAICGTIRCRYSQRPDVLVRDACSRVHHAASAHAAGTQEVL